MCGVLVAVRGFLSSCGAQTPEHMGSVVAAQRLSCPPACGTLVPQPGIEQASPALQDGFSTTGIPGKFLEIIFKLQYFQRLTKDFTFKYIVFLLLKTLHLFTLKHAYKINIIMSIIGCFKTSRLF